MDDAIGYIYQVTCLINGKTYIGLRHYSRDAGKAWGFYLGSGRLIKAAVAKHGRDQFSKVKLAEASSEEELQRLEWEHIKAAKAGGGAEYNLFQGPGAGGNTFARLTEDRLETIRRKQSLGLRRARATKRPAEEAARRLKTEELLEAHGERVTALYSELKTVVAVAGETGLSVKTVTRILEASGIRRRSINSLSKEERATLSAGYDKTALTLLNKRLPNGLTALQLHDRMVARSSELLLLRETLTRKELCQHFELSHQWLNVFLRDHGVPKRADNRFTTDSCRRCRLSSLGKI